MALTLLMCLVSAATTTMAPLAHRLNHVRSRIWRGRRAKTAPRAALWPFGMRSDAWDMTRTRIV